MLLFLIESTYQRKRYYIYLLIFIYYSLKIYLLLSLLIISLEWNYVYFLIIFEVKNAISTVMSYEIELLYIVNLRLNKSFYLTYTMKLSHLREYSTAPLEPSSSERSERCGHVENSRLNKLFYIINFELKFQKYR